MPIYDARENVNAQMRLAQNIGQSVGTFLGSQKRKEQAEAEKERRRINEMLSLQIMRGEGTPEEKLSMLESMPQTAELEFTKSMRRKQFEKSLTATQGKTQTQMLGEIEKLHTMIESTSEWNESEGRLVPIKGKEILFSGAQKRLKEVIPLAFGQVDIPEQPSEPEPPAEEKSLFQKFRDIPQSIDKSLRKVTPAEPGEPTIGEFIERKRAEREATEQPGTIVTGSTKKELDRNTAVAILNEAGGDKKKARQIARERGFEF